MSDMRPTIGEYGIPFCSEEACPQYDGKRCELLGFRPGRVCEPAVIELCRKLTRVEALPEKWRQVGHTYEVESISFDIAARELEAALKG